MKLIMFGPPSGHNAEGFIKYFKAQSKFSVTYICRGRSRWQGKGALRILSYETKFSQKIKDELASPVDFVWVHGGYDLRQLFGVFRTKKKNTPVSINVWGELVPNLIRQGTIKGRFYKYFFSKADSIHCNWHGTAKALEGQSFADRVFVQPWGLSDDMFLPESESAETTDFTKNFIKTLPKNKVCFFYPKSVLPVSGHLEVIDAVKLLVSQGKTNFVVYFWVGNTNDEELLNQCRERIDQSELSEFVKIVIHPFLPSSEIRKIWLEMDCGLQIAKSDQLSTTFLEPQLFGKELIATDIYPYRAYNKMYSSQIPLVDISCEAISKSMALAISTNGQENPLFNLRKDIVKAEFNFDKNFRKAVRKIVGP